MIKPLLFLTLVLCSILSFAQSSGDHLFDNTFLHQINLEAANIEDILTYPAYEHSGPVKMTIDGVVVDSIYLTRKGFTSNEFNNTNPPFKIDLDEYVLDQEYDGIDKFNLHNHYQDSYFQKNSLSYSLYRRAGVPAPHTSFVELYLNGVFIDIYTITEDIDKKFLQMNFASSEGSLYKGVEYPPNGFNVKKGTPDAFNNYINNLNAANWGDYADLHNFYRVITLDMLLLDDPSGQNDYMYFEPKSEKMHFIPWDKNFTFQFSSSIIDSTRILDPMTPFLFGRSTALYGNSLVKPYYLETVCELMSYLLDSTFVTNEATHNHTILMSNTQGLIIPPPDFLINYLDSVKTEYINVLSDLGYPNCHDNLPNVKLGDIVINEFVAFSDSTGIQEPSGGTPDWIELYNNSNADITLNEKYYLSDDKDFLKKWHFERDTIIPANGYMTLWADRDLHQANIHTNFKLEANAGDMFLVYEDLTVLDEIHYQQQELNKAFARIPNGTGSFTFQNPSFNISNDFAFQNCESMLEASMPIQDAVYESIDLTFSSGTINNGQRVIFQSEKSVLLNPRFEVRSNAIFKAEIDECDNIVWKVGSSSKDNNVSRSVLLQDSGPFNLWVLNNTNLCPNYAIELIVKVDNTIIHSETIEVINTNGNYFDGKLWTFSASANAEINVETNIIPSQIPTNQTIVCVTSGDMEFWLEY